MDLTSVQSTRRSTRLNSTSIGKQTVSQGTKRSARTVNQGNSKKMATTSDQPLSLEVSAKFIHFLTFQESTHRDLPIPDMSFEERDEAESQLLGLYSKIGDGCYALSRYNCQQAINIFKSLPSSQQNTPFVISRIARAQYESRNLTEAHKEFLSLRKLDPTRLEDMELFSTVLFHLNKEVDLAFLAHEMIDFDWLAPQTWCVVGNSYASQHDHDQAIACFQRAIQLDPRFAYAYSLQGLEHAENEEYDKASFCFIHALQANKRLYHAW